MRATRGLVLCALCGVSMAQTPTATSTGNPISNLPFAATALATGADSAFVPDGVAQATTTARIVSLVASALSAQSVAAAASASATPQYPKLYPPQDTAIAYTPPNTWTFDPGGGATPESVWSKDPTAQATFNYIGGAVVLVAAQKYDRGFFNVTLDSQFQGVFDLYNATASGDQPPELFVFDVGQIAEHRLIVSNYGNDSRIAGADKRTALDILAFYVDDTAAVPPASITSVGPVTYSFPAYNPSSGGSSSTNAGAIAGGVVGGVVALALIGVLAFCFLRKRRRAGRDFDDRRGSYVDDPHAAVEPFQTGPAMSQITPIGGVPRPGLPSTASESSTAPLTQHQSVPGSSNGDTSAPSRMLSIRTTTAATLADSSIAESNSEENLSNFMETPEADVATPNGPPPPSYAEILTPSASSSHSGGSTASPLPSPETVLRSPRQSSSMLGVVDAKGFMPMD